MTSELALRRTQTLPNLADTSLSQTSISGGARSAGTCADRLRRATGSLRHKCSAPPIASRNQRVPLRGWVREERQNICAQGKQKRPGLLASGTGKELLKMKCVVCEREVTDAENWLKIHLWAGFAIFHWSCFAEFLKHGDEAKVENAVWRAEHNR